MKGALGVEGRDGGTTSLLGKDGNYDEGSTTSQPGAKNY